MKVYIITNDCDDTPEFYEIRAVTDKREQAEKICERMNREETIMRFGECVIEEYDTDDYLDVDKVIDKY